MIKKLSDILLFENTIPVLFTPKFDIFQLLNEDEQYIPSTEIITGSNSNNNDIPNVPRFTLKGKDTIEEVPINKPLEPTQDLIIKAIKYGMIFSIVYKGAKDNHNKGRERLIYPMVFGKSSVGKLLIRGWHVNGWSVSQNRFTEKIWRMFRFDRIKSIIFTGSFHRLAPIGYNMFDKGMRGGIIVRADYNEIRRNQEKLTISGDIQNIKDVSLTPEVKNEIVKVQVKETNTKFDIDNPYDNPLIEELKDDKNLRISFLKSLYGNTYIAILGALSETGNTATIKTDKGKTIGTFRVLEGILGDTLKKIKNVKGNKIFDLYIFDKKL